MKTKRKLSFDFDDTLDREDIQEFAGALIKMSKQLDLNIEIWICTARFGPENAPNPRWNDDLFEVADRLKIPRERIIFAEMADKWTLLKDQGFIWHLDDDSEELNLLNKHTNIRGISSWGNNVWKNKCMRLLDIK